MAHTLRKYLSCRGSALFMVLSTMTALMICCMAMYFSVVSSRSTQYATFNQQQSYQSAVSISDTLIGGLNDGSLAEFGSLLNGLTNPGDSVTTGSNGFEAFGKTSGIESTDAYDSQLGAYSVTVTRLEDETVAGTTRKTYDVVVTTSVNGVKEAYHTVVYAPAEPPVTSGPSNTQIFAGTGYVPNDNAFNYGVFNTNVFLDSPEVFVKGYAGLGNDMKISSDLSCGGNMTINDYFEVTEDRPMTFAIRDTFKFTSASDNWLSFKGSEKSTVLVGRDMYIEGNCAIKNANVYILGDLYIAGNMGNLVDSNYFVAGKVYLNGKQVGKEGNVGLSGVRCSAVDNSLNGGVGPANPPAGKWDNSVSSSGFLTQEEALNLLLEKTETTNYYKWEIDTDKYPEVNPILGKKVTLKFTTTYLNPVPTYTLRYAEHARRVSDIEYEGKGCIIEDSVLTDDSGSVGYTGLTVIIDTGDDPDNTFVIRVQANRDFDGDGRNEAFSWKPSSTNEWSNRPVAVIVKGKGSVVIDVPEGVTYQDSDRQMTMHYGWFVLGGGTETTQTNGSIAYNAEVCQTGNMVTFYSQFVHMDCYDGDGCVYMEENSSSTCPNCGGFKKTVSCVSHGELSSYCPTCNPDLGGDHAGECSHHIDKDAIDAYLNTHPDLKERMKGDDGEVIYPTTNIFLVSIEESADIRLSYGLDQKQIIQNALFGYVYAPYMTLNLFGDNSGGGYIRLFGGATVSDYIIQSNPAVVGCWPSQMPMNAMDQEKLQEELPGAPKNWKFDVKLH